MKIIFRARRIHLSLLIPWKEQRNMLKIWQSSKEIIVFCLLQMFRWNQMSTDHLMHRPMVLGLLRHRFERLQHCSIIWTLCCTMLRLKMPQRRRQRERQKKSNRLNRQNNNSTLAACFFYISLSSLHDYDVKMPSFTFFGGLKRATTRIFLLFLNLDMNVRSSASE